MAETTRDSQLSDLKHTILDQVFPDDPTSDGALLFIQRMDDHAPDVITLLAEVYGEREDFDHWLREIFLTTARAFRERPEELIALDKRREDNPTWYQSHEMMGGVCYVDRFAETLQGVKDRIGYFKELGLTYLHLMPLFKTPPGPDDGGYAISSFREVAPDLGTMDDLIDLAASLRGNGISLVLDFVFNHTAYDHEWAERAKRGEAPYTDYYFLYEDRTIPDQYDQTLREIFPEEHKGCFTFQKDIKKWVWTTFHHYQWDLNYREPVVFRQMLEEMLFLANIGVEVLRLDALAFIWKEMNTPCENLPHAHTLVRAYNALVRIAAPGMIFKAEAIVHPRDVVQYFGDGEWSGKESEIAYNPLLMVELWEALATEHTHLLTLSMERWFSIIPENAAWVNYVRSHDDIGWGFADEDAADLHINGFDHRLYLNRFYTGEEPWSFAQGYPFQYNPANQDMRISGTAASLAGLERALNADDSYAVDLAIKRLLLIYSVVISMGGIPLIYLGDEIAMLNDYGYRDDHAIADDSRWVHRFRMDWERAGERFDPGSVPGRVFQTMQHLIGVRKVHPAFGAAARTTILQMPNRHIFAYEKEAWPSSIVAVTNFTPHDQHVPAESLPMLEPDQTYNELVQGRVIKGGTGLTLRPYAFHWFALHTRPE